MPSDCPDNHATVDVAGFCTTCGTQVPSGRTAGLSGGVVLAAMAVVVVIAVIVFVAT